MDDNITEKHLKSLDIPTTDHMALKFFTETILLLKVDCFEGILNWNKKLDQNLLIPCFPSPTHIIFTQPHW